MVWLPTPIALMFLFVLGSAISAAFWVRDYARLRRALGRTPSVVLQPPYWPKVSVILPAWREATVVDRCLHSMLALDYPSENVEFIVVAGGPDGTFETALAHSSSRVRVMRQEPRGKGAALNEGIKSAIGDLIVTTDADCVFPADWLKKIVIPLTDGRADAVGGRAEVLNDRTFVTKYFKIYEEIVARQIYASSRTVLAGENSAFRKQALQTVGMFDEAVHIIVDGNLEWKLRQSGFSMFYDMSVAVKREYPESISEYFRQQSRWMRGIMQLFFRYRRFIVSKSRFRGLMAYVRYVRLPATAFAFYLLIPASFFLPGLWPIPVFVYFTLVLRNLSRPLMAASYSKDYTLLRYLWLPLFFVPLNLLIHMRATIDQITRRSEPLAFETKRYATRT